MIMRAAIYTRIRVEDQAGGRSRLDEQREICQAAADSKGWVVAAEFSDGPNGSNKFVPPGLAQFLEAACSDDVDAAIIPSLASLGGSVSLILARLEQLNKCGVIIVSCEEGLDTESSSGRFAMKLFSTLTALKSDVTGALPSKGRDARGRIDGERGGQLPMGYTRVFDASGSSLGVEIDEAVAETVRYMFTLRSMGNSLQAIADKLNDFGVTTTREKKWHPSSVKIVLDNEDKYRGGRRWKSSYRWPRILEI